MIQYQDMKGFPESQGEQLSPGGEFSVGLSDIRGLCSAFVNKYKILGIAHDANTGLPVALVFSPKTPAETLASTDTDHA